MSRTESVKAYPWLQARPADDGQSLAAQIYRHLRAAIVEGAAAPGELLVEPLIAKTFGVSRTPVREALLKLRDNGLVDIRRQSGTFVAEIDPAHVEEGMLVRESLEPRVAEVTAMRITKAQLRVLSHETDQMADAVTANDGARFIKADDRFHQMIIEASGFAHVAELIERVNAPLDRVRYLSLSEPVRARTAVREHRQLIKLLGAADGPGSAESLATHLRGSWVIIRSILNASGCSPHVEKLLVAAI